MSWKSISSTLNRLSSSGPKGFEGLVGILLGELLDQRFLIARSGDQPGGDGSSYRGEIRFQAKHYKKSKIKKADVEADFLRIFDSHPEMEVYVVASAGTIDEQMRSGLNRLEAQFGIDIVSLDYSHECAALAALLAVYWDSVKSFGPLSRLSKASKEWVSQHASQEKTSAVAKVLRQELVGSTRLYGVLRGAARNRLFRRIGLAGEDSPEDFRIDASKAIPRQSVRDAVEGWIRSDKSPALLIEGGEGFGKSWAAAMAAKELTEGHGLVVVWLDSSRWEGVQDLDELRGKALRGLPLENVIDWDGWDRKLWLRWTERLYLVLDGVNERPSGLATSQRLLKELLDTTGRRPRIIFTARPLNVLYEVEPVWKLVAHCKLGPFDDVEFPLALGGFSPPLRVADIPKALVNLARIPRLLPTCVRLRNEFGGFETVTREMVLWAELLDKIERLDLQIRKTLGWRVGEEAATSLSRIAAGILKSGCMDVQMDVLKTCFVADPRRILESLEELRLADRASLMRTTVSADVNRLGLALLIRELLRQPAAPTVGEQADRFRKLLEPLADVDERVQALFAALQLTCQFPPDPAPDLSRHRAALLFMWASHRNSGVGDGQLEFWARNDSEAYCGFVEHVYEDVLSDSIVDFIIGPLALVWRENVAAAKHLDPFLRRWLLLTWPDGEERASDSIEHFGHHLPVAQTQPQLRLTLAAIHILSARSDESFLPQLAVSRATLGLAKVTRMDRLSPRPDSVQKPYKMSLKDWQENFQSLLRFGFTESVIQQLLHLVGSGNQDGLVIDGLKLLARDLEMDQTPAELCIPKANSSFVWNRRSAVDLIRLGKKLFPDSREELFVIEREFQHLALRDDLPELKPEDAARLIQRAEEAILSAELETSGRSMTLADYEWRATHAWLARFQPRRFLELTSDFRCKLFSFQEPLGALLMIGDYLHDPGQTPIAELRKRMQEFWRERATGMDRVQVHIAHRLNRMALLNYDDQNLRSWLEFAVEDTHLRETIAGFAYFGFLKVCLSPRLHGWFLERLLRHLDDALPDPDVARERFDFWCVLAAASAEHSEERFLSLLVEFRRIQPTGDRLFHWLQLLFAVVPDHLLAAGVGEWNPQIHFDKTGCGTLWFIQRQLQPRWLNSIPLSDLLKALPVGEVGNALMGAGRWDEFAQWGLELLGRAQELAGLAAPERRYWGDFSLEFDTAGHVHLEYVWTGAPKHNDPKPVSFDPPKSGLLDQFFSDGNDDANEVLKLGNADYDALHESAFEGYFNFGGLPALSEWRRRHSDDFLRLAKPYLAVAAQAPKHAHRMGALIHAVICNLLPLEPDEALAAYRALTEGGMRFQCNTEHRIPQFEEALWNANECRLPRHEEIRRERMLRTESECGVVVAMLAAQANGSSRMAHSLANRFCKASTANRRAVGVSMLAWIMDEASLQVIEGIARNDPVLWLREHAEWAAEVHRQNGASARFYRRVLTEPDPAIMSTMLAQLRPALSPTACWWRHEVEAAVLAGTDLPKRHHAVLINFWLDRNPRDLKAVEIAGRKLSEWRFGENCSRLKHPAPIPSW